MAKEIIKLDKKTEAVEEKMELSIENQHFVETKKKLDDIGPGMCLAKWTQVTLHMQGQLVLNIMPHLVIHLQTQ